MDEALKDFRELTKRVAGKLGRMADELQRDAEFARFRQWRDSLPGPDHVAEFPIAPLKASRLRVVLPTVFLKTAPARRAA